MTRALITGVTGQDGSYLAEQLLAEGVEVHGLVHPASAERPPTSGVVAHEGDLEDGEALRRLVLDLAPDTIYNLAGISSVAMSWQVPGLTARLTGVAPLELMDAALAAQDATGREVRFVQASSAEIFGEAAVSPQDEDTPVRPVTPYGVAKAMAHQATLVYRGRGLHAASCILYNHESPRRPPTFVTRKITQGVARISQGRLDRLALGNLDAERDWGWAPDYVDAMVRAGRHATPTDFVVATGVAHSVREFVAAAFRAGRDHRLARPGRGRPGVRATQRPDGAVRRPEPRPRAPRLGADRVVRRARRPDGRRRPRGGADVVSRPRVAIAHDYLTQRGGAERVVLAMLRAFPDATLHTTLYDAERTYPEFREHRIVTSPLNRVRALREDHRRALPFMAWAAGRMHVDADVTLASSSGWAHGFDITGRRLVYCHAPRDGSTSPGPTSAAPCGAHRPAGCSARSVVRSCAGTPARRHAATATSPTRASCARASRSSTASRPTSYLRRSRSTPPGRRSRSPAPSPGARGGTSSWWSRLLPYKNVDVVIEAVRGTSDRLMVIGAGPEQDRLMRVSRTTC